MTKKPVVSIIIPNLHSPIIDRTIESVLGQETEIPYEIIVVGKDKYGLIERYPEVKSIITPTAVGAAKARNIGIGASQGEWLFFLDSDCIAQKNWITSFVNRLEEGYKVVGGSVLSDPNDFWPHVYNLAMFHEQTPSQKPKGKKFLPTLNLAVQREVIEKVGLLNEALIRGQDVEWTARMTLAGFTLLFEPSAIVEHKPDRPDFNSLKSFFYQTGYYSIQTRYQFPKIFHMPKLLRNRFIWKIFSPVIAAYITVKNAFQSQELRKNLRVLPYIFRLKVSWCFGASDGLREMKK